MARLSTEVMGSSEAIVTSPNAASGLSPLLLGEAAHTPSPSAITVGTVTGPVVTAPQSQASAMTPCVSCVKAWTMPVSESVMASRM